MSKAMFFFTLPILVVCLLAWAISGYWIFPTIYAFAWLIGLSCKYGFKAIGLEL
jgi:hypothetical protein